MHATRAGSAVSKRLSFFPCCPARKQATTTYSRAIQTLPLANIIILISRIACDPFMLDLVSYKCKLGKKGGGSGFRQNGEDRKTREACGASNVKSTADLTWNLLGPVASCGKDHR